MPLTEFQRQLLAELAKNHSEDRYLAGGAALHFAPNSTRYSDDLDFFHDSIERVAATFASDSARLTDAGYSVTVELSQPGFVRATVSQAAHATRIDWAHDSMWRFMPLVRDTLGGLLLHPVDLAINKILALAGRDEPRDYLDILFAHARILSIGALCWAAVGKDPGFTPLSLLELLKRRGRYQANQFARLDLVEPFDLVTAKEQWLAALADAETLIKEQSPVEIGCLYWSLERETFVMPRPGDVTSGRVLPHFGVPGGVLPRISDSSIRS